MDACVAQLVVPAAVGTHGEGMMTRLMACIALAVGVTLVPARPAAAQQQSGVLTPTIGAPQYFAVLVADADDTARWYRRAFGLREVGRSSAADGSWEIVNLTSDQLLVEIIRDDRARPAVRARGFFKVGFHVPDVEAAADAVERITGERPPVVDVPDQGVRVVQLRDPDGNTIQLFSWLAR